MNARNRDSCRQLFKKLKILINSFYLEKYYIIGMTTISLIMIKIFVMEV